MRDIPLTFPIPHSIRAIILGMPLILSIDSELIITLASGVVLGTGTRVATRYPGTRSGPGYPGIFITRLLSTQHCRLDCEYGVIDNIYHEVYCKYVQTASITAPFSLLWRSVYSLLTDYPR